MAPPPPPPTSTSTIPPELPPSVEAAYRAKCIQLKQRLNELEESNDASRLRLERIRKSIEKQRLERAFLLEQVAKRTSTNVEDSEGSPSPPPTVGIPNPSAERTIIESSLQQPKEKPLRTKRGHRKPDFLTTDLGDGRPGSAFIQQGPVTLSPSSDAFSHTHHDPLRNSTPQAQSQSIKRQLPTNGTYATPAGASSTTPAKPHRPKNAFEVYTAETRPILVNEHRKEIADGTFDIEAVLARGWSTLDGEKKGEFTQRFELIKKSADAEKEGTGVPKQAVFDASVGQAEDGDEDVEMGDDTGGAEAGGFTAVNRT